MAIRINGNTVIDDNKVVIVSANTTINRPATPLTGMIRFNTTDVVFEGYNGTTWSGLGGSDETARTLALLALN